MRTLLLILVAFLNYLKERQSKELAIVAGDFCPAPL